MALLPDPHKNWWCYTNRYVQQTGKVFDKDKLLLPPDIKSSCCREDGHLSNSEKDFNQAIVLTCYQPTNDPGIYGDKQCFLHVYGVRKTVYLMFKESAVDNWFYLTTRESMLAYFQSMELQFVRDMKLVFKRPYKNACVRPRLFLKLYIQGAFPKTKLKDIVQTMQQSDMACIDKTTLHGHSLEPDTRWFNAKRAYPVGRVKTTRPVHVIDKGAYYDAQVHHADVIFDNMEETDCPFTADKSPNEIFDEIFQTVVRPVIDRHATGPTKNVIRHDISVARGAFSGVLGPPEQWTWRKLKKCFFHNIFHFVSKQVRNTFLDSHIKRYGGYLEDEAIEIEHISLRDGVKHVYFETLLIAYEVKAALKLFWRDRVLAKTATQREDHLSTLSRTLSSQRRWLVFDIETDHKPHEIKEESIIAISTTLFDHRNADALEYVLFLRMPPDIPPEKYREVVPGVEVVQLIQSQLKEKYLDMMYEKNFHIKFCSTEKELLQEFGNYTCQTRCFFVGYFNGHKFDLPFVANRSAVNSASTEAKKARLIRNRSPMKPYTVLCSFSYKCDQGSLIYDPPAKKHNYKTYGQNVWADRVLKERATLQAEKQKQRTKKRYERLLGYDENEEQSTGEDSDINDEAQKEDQAEEEEVVLANTTGKYQWFLVAARKVQSVLMNHVVLVDVMKFVSENKRRGCKLDVAAKKILGVQKYDDPAVSYENLYNTWLRGDKVKLACYAMIDTLLTKDLVVVKKLCSFHLTLSEIIGLSEREIYLEESVRRLISLADRLGFNENLLTPDTSLLRNEQYPWIPDCPWDTSRDYKHLRPPGGTTVPGVFGIFFTPCATVDFKGQYPSIMAGYNICLTSLIDPEDIERDGLVEGKDYFQMELENVRPLVKHVCSEKGRVCDATAEGKGDPTKCKFDVEYVIVKYKVYFVTENRYMSVLNRSSRKMRVARSMYKELRDDAANRGDTIARDVFELYQLAVKTVDNSTYGGTMRFNGIVGDAITNTARSQARCLAKLGAEKNMAVMNGDTDSVFIQLIPDPKDCENFSTMARFYGMTPRTTTVTDIFHRLLGDAQNFVDRVNGEDGISAPLFPKPCFLEFEKIFPFLCNFAKKNYGGEKMLSNMTVYAHRTGMTGKKADSTVVKKSAQFISIKLLGRRDFQGLFAFARDLYDCVSWEIRHQDKKNAEISHLCSLIPENDLHSKPAEVAREKIRKIIENENRRQSRGEGLIPLAWLEGKERVGDVDDPKTLSTKRAVELCKYLGEDRHNAPMFVEMCRTSSVQVARGLTTILSTFLNSPAPAGYKERRDARFAAGHDKKACVKREKLETAAVTRWTKKAAEVSKLDVTAMPIQWRVKPEAMYCPTEKQRVSAEVLRDYIIDRDKILTLERDNGFPTPPVPGPEVTSWAKERLHMFIREFTDCDPFPPPHMFPPDMAVSNMKHMTEDHCLPKPDSACDIWSLYVEDMLNQQLRFVALSLKENRVQFRFGGALPPQQIAKELILFGPEHCSWYKVNIHCISKSQNVEFLLDMAAYRQQTQTTPYILPSYDGKKQFLVNRDSYVSNKQNSFAFEVSLRSVLEMLETMSPEMTVENIVGTQKVVFRDEKQTIPLAAHRILRDDGRPVPCWLWVETPFQVQTTVLKRAMEMFIKQPPLTVKHVSLSLNRDKNRLEISDEVGFNVIYLHLGTDRKLTQKRVNETPPYWLEKPKRRKKTDTGLPSVYDYFARV